MSNVEELVAPLIEQLRKAAESNEYEAERLETELSLRDFHSRTNDSVAEFVPLIQSAMAQIYRTEDIRHATRVAYVQKSSARDRAFSVLNGVQRVLEPLAKVLSDVHARAYAHADIAAPAVDFIKLAGEIADSLRERLLGTIDKAASVGMAPRQLGLELEAQMRDEYRAALIAENEYVKALGAATLDSYHQNGVGLIRWIAQPEACPMCRANMMASPISIFSEWPNGSLPAHPNCRCALAPYEGV